MERLNREILLKEQVRSLVSVAEQLKQKLDEVSKLGNQFLSDSEDAEFATSSQPVFVKQQTSTIARKQKSHQMISGRSLTPVASNTSALWTTTSYSRTLPIDFETANDTNETNLSHPKPKKEWEFPPLILKPIARRHLLDNCKLHWDEPLIEELSIEDESSSEKIRSKNLTFCPTVVCDKRDSICEDNESSNGSSNGNDWRRRYVTNKDSVQADETYLQTLVNIDDEVYPSLIANGRSVATNASSYVFDNNTSLPDLYHAMEANWKCRYAKHPNQSTLITVNSVLEATNKDNADLSYVESVARPTTESDRSSLCSMPALSLPSLSPHSEEDKCDASTRGTSCLNVKKCTAESSWMTVVESECRKATVTKLGDAKDCCGAVELYQITNEETQRAIFSEGYTSENKDTVVQKSRGRLAVLGKSTTVGDRRRRCRSLVKRCKHVAYCILCGHHFKSKSAKNRKVVKNGMVRQLVARWEKFHGKQCK